MLNKEVNMLAKIFIILLLIMLTACQKISVSGDADTEQNEADMDQEVADIEQDAADIDNSVPEPDESECEEIIQYDCFIPESTSYCEFNSIAYCGFTDDPCGEGYEEYYSSCGDDLVCGYSEKDKAQCMTEEEITNSALNGVWFLVPETFSGDLEKEAENILEIDNDSFKLFSYLTDYPYKELIYEGSVNYTGSDGSFVLISDGMDDGQTQIAGTAQQDSRDIVFIDPVTFYTTLVDDSQNGYRLERCGYWLYF